MVGLRADWLLDHTSSFATLHPRLLFPKATIRRGSSASYPPAKIRGGLSTALFVLGVFLERRHDAVGYEFGFSRPLNVVTTRRTIGKHRASNLSGFVSEVNAMKSRIPALNDEGLERRLTTGHASALALVRYASRGGTMRSR